MSELLFKRSQIRVVIGDWKKVKALVHIYLTCFNPMFKYASIHWIGLYNS